MDRGVSTQAKLLFTVRPCHRPIQIFLLNSEICGSSLPGPFVPWEECWCQLPNTAPNLFVRRCLHADAFDWLPLQPFRSAQAVIRMFSGPNLTGAGVRKATVMKGQGFRVRRLAARLCQNELCDNEQSPNSLGFQVPHLLKKCHLLCSGHTVAVQAQQGTWRESGATKNAGVWTVTQDPGPCQVGALLTGVGVVPSSIPGRCVPLSTSPDLLSIPFHFCKIGTDVATSGSLGTKWSNSAQCLTMEPVCPVLSASSVGRITSRTLTR